MNKKKIIPIVLLLIVVAGAAVFWSRLSGESDGRIRISGNIELKKVDIAFKVAGKLVELRVDEGSQVTRDMPIARLDQDQILRTRGRDRAGVVLAESQLAQLRTAILWQRESLSGEIDVRKAEMQQAQARLNDLLAGARPQEIQQSRSAVDDARTQHEQARRDWDRAQALYKNDDISTAQFDQFKARFNSTAATLKQAEERLALVVEGPRKEEIESARAQVTRAAAAVRLAEANRLEIQRKEQELGARQADSERARQQVAIVEAQIEDTVAISPISGVVLVKSADPGEVLAAGTTVVTIGDIDRPWLRGYISEQNLGRVKLGAKANVTSDSFPGKIYAGRVSFIASEAEFTPKQIQTSEERLKLVYRIKIDVENPGRELKSNMPVDAEILLDGR